MYCIHCGKQLPDNANFCFHCGKQTVTDQVISQEDAIEQKTLKEPATQPEPEQNKPTDSVQQPESREPERQCGNTVDESAEEVLQKSSESMVNPQIKEKARRFVNSKKGLITIGIATLVVILLIVIICVAGGRKFSVPNPDVYFGMQHVGNEKVKKNSSDEYVYYYQSTNNMLPAMGGYARLLFEEYDFILSNTNGTEESATYYFVGGDGAKIAKIKMSYYPEGEYNFIVTYSGNIKVHDKGERYEGRIESSSGSDIIDKLNDPSYWEEIFEKNWNLSDTTDNQDDTADNADATVQQNEEIGEDLAVQEETDTMDDLPEELKNRDPALIPCPLDYDSSGLFRCQDVVTYGKDESILWLTFHADDADASYVGFEYIELLKKMGYEVVEELNNGVMLSHPDVSADPVFDGVRTDDPASSGQIEIRIPVFDEYDACKISIEFLGNGIKMEGYEEKFKELTANQSSSSDGASSSSNDDDNGSADLDSDLYDTKAPCNICNRSGDCQTCSGDGYLWSSAADKENRNCYSCSGSGNCRSCGGDGWL